MKLSISSKCAGLILYYCMPVYFNSSLVSLFKVLQQNPYLTVFQFSWFLLVYQFTMELAGTGDRNMPKRYSMDMSTDFVPMSVLSESSQGHFCKRSLMHQTLFIILFLSVERSYFWVRAKSNMIEVLTFLPISCLSIPFYSSILSFFQYLSINAGLYFHCLSSFTIPRSGIPLYCDPTKAFPSSWLICKYISCYEILDFSICLLFESLRQDQWPSA